MATTTSKRTERITREVVVELDPEEYLESSGDRKPKGGRRPARLTSVAINYSWDDGRWYASTWSVKGRKEQQKADGTWGAGEWSTYPEASRAAIDKLIAQHTPNTTIIITEQENI